MWWKCCKCGEKDIIVVKELEGITTDCMSDQWWLEGPNHASMYSCFYHCQLSQINMIELYNKKNSQCILGPFSV